MTLLAREAQRFFHTYKRIPLDISRGEGMYLYTADGKKYLDMFSGLAVNALGYSHPRIVEAIRTQSERFVHVSNYYLQEPQILLAELLTRYAGYSKVFFTNSGTESVEGALKLARRWGSGQKRSSVVSFSNSFHGRTMGALSLMDRPKYREGFGPFLNNCCLVEFNDVEGLRHSVNSATAAIILECIQGEGGVVPITPEFAQEIAELKKNYGFLLIADEIQSGIGRTGKFFGFQQYDLAPDIVVVAKPIGGGLPLGAILSTDEIAGVLQPGMHGTTFGGNPVACAAGIVVLDEVMEHGLLQNAQAMGKVLFEALLGLKEEFPALIHEVRGYGLMLGMDLRREGESIVQQLRDRGILLNCTNSTVLRFLPPLIVKNEHISETVSQLREILKKL